jgi:hypothetical protein
VFAIILVFVYTKVKVFAIVLVYTKVQVFAIILVYMSGTGEVAALMLFFIHVSEVYKRTKWPV